MVYVDSEVEDDLIVGQGLLDSSTGEFSVTVEDLPTGSSKVYFSFSVLDPTHTPQYYGPNAVFYATVAHDDCTWPLTVKVEWATEDLSYRFSTDDWFALYIQEPDGNVVSPSQTGVRAQMPTNQGWYSFALVPLLRHTMHITRWFIGRRGGRCRRPPL